MTKNEFKEILKKHIETFEALPPNAMMLPVNHYDFLTLLYLINQFLNLEEKPESK